MRSPGPCPRRTRSRPRRSGCWAPTPSPRTRSTAAAAGPTVREARTRPWCGRRSPPSRPATTPRPSPPGATADWSRPPARCCPHTRRTAAARARPGGRLAGHRSMAPALAPGLPARLARTARTRRPPHRPALRPDRGPGARVRARGAPPRLAAGRRTRQMAGQAAADPAVARPGQRTALRPADERRPAGRRAPHRRADLLRTGPVTTARAAPPKPRAHPGAELLDTLVAEGLDWTERHRAHFRLPPDVATTADPNLTLKPLGELAELSALIAELHPVPELRDRARRLLAHAWQETRRGELFAELVQGEPQATYPVELYGSFARAGLRDAAVDELVRTTTGLRGWQLAREDHTRTLAVLNAEARIGVPHHTDFAGALAHTWLGRLPEPWFLECRTAYGLTHDVFHLTDWGRAPSRLSPRRGRVSAAVAPGMAGQLAGGAAVGSGRRTPRRRRLSAGRRARHGGLAAAGRGTHRRRRPARAGRPAAARHRPRRVLHRLLPLHARAGVRRHPGADRDPGQRGSRMTTTAPAPAPPALLHGVGDPRAGLARRQPRPLPAHGGGPGARRRADGAPQADRRAGHQHADALPGGCGGQPPAGAGHLAAGLRLAGAAGRRQRPGHAPARRALLPRTAGDLRRLPRAGPPAPRPGGRAARPARHPRLAGPGDGPQPAARRPERGAPDGTGAERGLRRDPRHHRAGQAAGAVAVQLHIAYDITHTVFHLTNWGEQPEGIPEELARYLELYLPAWAADWAELEHWDLLGELSSSSTPACRTPRWTGRCGSGTRRRSRRRARCRCADRCRRAIRPTSSTWCTTPRWCPRSPPRWPPPAPCRAAAREPGRLPDRARRAAGEHLRLRGGAHRPAGPRSGPCGRPGRGVRRHPARPAHRGGRRPGTAAGHSARGAALRTGLALQDLHRAAAGDAGRGGRAAPGRSAHRPSAARGPARASRGAPHHAAPSGHAHLRTAPRPARARPGRTAAAAQQRLRPLRHRAAAAQLRRHPAAASGGPQVDLLQLRDRPAGAPPSPGRAAGASPRYWAPGCCGPSG